MTRKRNLWIFVGAVILLAAVLSGFLFAQPSAEDILLKTLETRDTITDAHAVVALSMDTVEKNETATVEVWGRQGEDEPGAFRLEVLDTSDEKAAGAMVVSDGETLWAYAPSKGKVFVGTLEEAKNMLAEREIEQGDFARDGFEHPESAEDALQMLLEYFTPEKMGTEQVANETAYLLKLEPVPEQMPSKYATVGGFIKLWIDQGRYVPLAVEYTGGSLGEFSATVSELELNTGLEQALFSFEIPADVEVVPFIDLVPKSLSLEEAAEAVEFELLTPAEIPQGATLVDILEMRGSIVQRYTLPDGGSFTVVQGISGEVPNPPADNQPVEVRGVTGTLFVAEDGSQVLLTWNEGDLYYYIAGTLTPDQALTVAESLN